MSLATPILGARRGNAASRTVFEEESDDEDYDETSPEVKDPELGNSLGALEYRSIALDATAPDAHANGDLFISDTHDQAEMNRLSRLAVTTLGSSDESTESNTDMNIVIDDHNPREDTESEDEVTHQPSNERSSPCNVPERHGLSPVITPEGTAAGSNFNHATTELDEIHNFPIYEDGISTLLEEIPIKSESSRALKQSKIDRLSDDRETGIFLDPDYARILNSSTGRQSVTPHPDMVPEEERKLDFQGDGENVDDLLSVWRRDHKPDDAKTHALDRRHARDELVNWRHTFDNIPEGSVDPDYARIMGSAAPAVFPSTDTLNDQSSPEEWPRKAYGSDRDEKYRRIFQRHGVSFGQPLTRSRASPVEKMTCSSCGLLKTPREFSPSVRENGIFHGRRTCQICQSILQQDTGYPDDSDEPIEQEKCADGFGGSSQSITSLCSTARRGGPKKGTSLQDSWSPKKESCSKSTTPVEYIKQKSILGSIRGSRPARPKSKVETDSDPDGFLERLEQRDQQIQRGMPHISMTDVDSPSSWRPETSISQLPIVSRLRFVKLGVMTGPDQLPIWIRVSRSAPLSELFIAAVQSDEALRNHVFMLPGRFVRWDDTADKLDLKDEDCFEMRELPDTWLPLVKTAHSPEAEETIRESSVVTVKSEHTPEAEGATRNSSTMTSPVGPMVDDKTQAELLAIAHETAEDVVSECSASDSHKSSEDAMSERSTSERQRSLGSQRQCEPYNTSFISDNASPSTLATHRSRDTSLIRNIKASVKRALHEEYYSYGGNSKRRKHGDTSPGGIQLDKPTQGYNLR
ncbi:hypothetical protein D6D01_06551 [Aureobasidium pullulans]|uniref:Uncharacterized protein n=1 Tax=Aureobasidium pullulans TaxID=5580 RepID=A0A4S9KZX3_AURPU|nr:hypothetical protein D6D01_06551 [Aureobasidium pullulans]